jgi:dienelactone hydrolase
MVTMRRRTLIVSLTTAAAGALAGCTTQPSAKAPVPGPMPTPSSVPSPSVAPSPSGSAVTSPFSSTKRSTLAPQTPLPVTPAPGTAPAGDFAVGTRSLHFSHGAARPLPVTLWYPATWAGEGAPVADGRFPLVLFSHGLQSEPEGYRSLLTRWAEAGFVVAGPRYPHTAYQTGDFRPLDIVNQPADASYVLTELLKLDAGGDALAGRLATDRVAAAGHSGGGITTVGLFTGHRDERLKAGVVLAGTDLLGAPFAGSPAPMLFVHGRKDETVAWSAARTVFRAVPWSRAMLSITQGGHLSGGGDFAAIRATTTDFLRWSLYGDAAAKARIPADAATGGEATLENEL